MGGIFRPVGQLGLFCAALIAFLYVDALKEEAYLSSRAAAGPWLLELIADRLSPASDPFFALAAQSEDSGPPQDPWARYRSPLRAGSGTVVSLIGAVVEAETVPAAVE